MFKYMIMYNRQQGVTNEQFYSKFYGYEFVADNDQDAIKQVKGFQRDCEREQVTAGVSLCGYDPLLISGLYKYDPVSDEFSVQIEE